MRIAVQHTTVYHYDSPVYQEPHTFRLRPRDDGAQRLLSFQLSILPEPSGRAECLDQDGNVVVEAWFGGMLERMEVRSGFEMETLRENPFDFHLAMPGMATLPLVYPEPLASAVVPYLGGIGCGPVREFARGIAKAAGWNTLAFLNTLNQRLCDDTSKVIRDQGAPFAPDVTLASREGSCRDLAVLFVAACRSVGIPARFVSGYEREAALQETAHMHAWAEVYLAGGGWRGYDPSQGLATYTAHVAVAAAADSRLAAPISGTFRGAAKVRMEYSIQMQTSG
jgi:transglutaminase-like putative cysteine protease